ncbi:hypothetical protein DOM21_14965 [Bacteriovorax stolpii]|uniref:helix-turn-helix transcriptional regulator n=1 Tax=Bacteriovorax stolpii TaxID=960 RepID=UPI00115BB0E5|nr:helix-turn-helix transcriptional regulator [Bacteriovorax stolpii]QDK42728.1 hypothetical protein DOM21_14965 [Bacteriovorax stolpii]
MITNIANIFKAVRNFYGLQQTEFAAVLGVTQGSISKIEASIMKPEMALWFKFTKSFHILDPCCCEYGGVEINLSKDKNQSSFQSPFVPQIAFDLKKNYVLVKDIKPILDLLKKEAAVQLKLIFEGYKINSRILYIHNHPLPINFVDEVLSCFNTVVSNQDLEKIDFEFNTSYGYSAQNLKMNNLRDCIQHIEKETKICKFYFDNENLYSVKISKEFSSVIDQLDFGDLFTEYLILLPYLLQQYLNKNNKRPIQEMKVNQNEWMVAFS